MPASSSTSTNGVNNNNSYTYYSPIGSNNVISPNIKADNVHKAVLKSAPKNINQRVVNFNEDDDLLSSSENSCEELSLKLSKNLTPQSKHMEKSIESLLNGLDSTGGGSSGAGGDQSQVEISSVSVQKFSFKNRTSLVNTSSSPIKNAGAEQFMNTNLNKRPDLVLDLPINLLVSSSPNSNNQNVSSNIIYLTGY